MKNIKLQQSLSNLDRALTRLEEALNVEKSNPLLIDGTIQRFEFTIELLWKTLKRALAEEGIQTTTPRETLKSAFSQYWLDNETVWLQMLSDRNLTSHIYDDAAAERIFFHIKQYYPLIKKAHVFLQQRFS